MRHARTQDSGLDGHHECMAVAAVATEHDAEGTDLGPIGTRQVDSDPLMRKRPSKAQHLVFVDEAGPCGAWLSRYLTQKNLLCWVVAPSWIPQQAGARVHTDRRDAGPLARLMRAGDVTPVSGPSVDEEAIRDRTRARDDSRRALKAAALRLKAVWLRHDIRDTARAPWSPAPLRWLREVVCPTPARPIVVPDYVRAVPVQTARLPRLEPARHEPVTAGRLQPGVAALPALRGGNSRERSPCWRHSGTARASTLPDP